MEKTKMISSWVKNHKLEFWLLIAILGLAAFSRLYKITDYMTFLGDEGRDALIVRRLLVDFDPILIGPGTSIGNMYLGPLYYYMMAPALLLAQFSPVGPAAMIALLGVATVWLVWYVTRKFTASSGINWGALTAALLYALSPVAIVYSRSSWNPNIMPFFALLVIFAIWKFWKEAKVAWIVVATVSLAFTLQSHYLALLLIPVFSIFWIVKLIRDRRVQEEKGEMQGTRLKKFSVVGAALFLFLMSPLVIFDARHGWNNFSAMKKFFLERQTTVSAKPWSALPNLWPRWVKITNSLFIGEENAALAKFIALFLLISFIWLVVRYLKAKTNTDNKVRAALLLIFVWLGFALIGLGVYKQEIYSHYYGFFQTAIFILVGIVVFDLLTKKVNPKIQALFFAGLFMLPFVQLSASPLKYGGARQLERAKVVANKIADESEGKRFNLAVVAERNYEDGYQYFLEKADLPVIEIDAQRAEETVTDQLFVVCELPKEKCDPTHSGKAEITSFGWTKVEAEWEVFGVTLYKLVHSNEL